ncbi:MAG: hypothetical protein A2086_10470 [Spirochaetes bacterium GWD1_27_9]|nr:MAG: hypothetical protein A2Z98_08770 [Spirochaetes bacterium GWB1_27_13]OHD25417.1 MAG: hypothetical protein A2Y34_10905 [Spirochaetes bacterium GWC1_27_15]OHD29491.1 MAG: hypothetical protein A2086_10470 [Spirochaetes bacterium GWD1_27_9]
MDISSNFFMLVDQFKTMFPNSFLNRILILVCSAHISSMILKGIINSIKQRKLNFKNMANYGGMPSSHTVFAISFTFGIAFDKNYGFSHPLFVLSIIVAAIIIMDAVRLRGTIDNINDILKEVTKTNPDLKDKIKFPKNVAHKLSEVLGGIVFAFIYTLIFYLFFYNVFK